MVIGIMRGIVAFVVSAILGGVCLVFGFSPDEWIAAVIAQPPSWLLHPLTRVAGVAIGGLFGFLAWKLWPWRSAGAARDVGQRFPAADINEWRQVDPLLLWQAGCLWRGIKPRYPVTFDNPAYGTFSMLLRAAEHGELELIKKEPTPEFAHSQVTRRELARYAIQKGESPEFLADVIPDEKIENRKQAKKKRLKY